ncbi:DNA-binding protein [Arcobacter arenosus]|uniref:DNA-binding protein n=1 Tax=Arcobacter arenosus TaxID=2576037 RepID=UPI003BA8661D
MERLVTTAQAAEILGISLQGVHYRIKKNQLKSIKKSGKTYVYINDTQKISPTATNSEEEPKVEMITFKETIKEVVKAKDEQILLLKKSIKWMRKQHGAEILRLENNQKRIIGVFNREIELLQSAFNEMRSIYKPQLISQQENKEKPQEKTKEKFISIVDFTLYLKRHNKSEREIKLIIMKAIERKDSRFIFNKKDRKLLILNEDFSDLI